MAKSKLVIALLLSNLLAVPLAAQQTISQGQDSLEKLAQDFWQWRARFQPFTKDDIPRIERPGGLRDWSAASVAKQRVDLDTFEARLRQLNTWGWEISRKIDYRLIGSALARVHWELDIQRRWVVDPTFYLDQSLTALQDELLPPPPFDQARSREIIVRMENIPQILNDAKTNLQPLRPFASLAIADLQSIDAQLMQVEREVEPMLQRDPGANTQVEAFRKASNNAIRALGEYRAWLQQHLAFMPEKIAVGRKNYQFFLQRVALLPYTPEQLIAMSHQEWTRTMAFEEYEKHHNQGAPELKIASSFEEQVNHSKRDESAIRKFLNDKRILTVPQEIGHYTIRALLGYLNALSDFGELDDFTGPSRLNQDAVRWLTQPSNDLGYFWLATAKDARPDMVHEGIPGHYFQMCLSWKHEDPIRRHYYDSGANEGIGFYSEEMMLQAGLFDDSPRSREIIYNFMRLRALRVEVDVKLALGIFTLTQAGEYLAQHVPMDRKSAEAEAALFATTPGQAISYQTGKLQILNFLAEAKLVQGDKFNLRAFHDYVWKNGNVPISLQRWEYLGQDEDVRLLDQVTH